MSMYNMVMGTNPYAMPLLKILRLDPKEIPRFRDTYWNGECIVVLTRTGGGNRKDYMTENQALTKWPGYVRDEDDSFDSTYALFHFEMPKEFEWVKARVIPEVRSLRERLDDALARMRSGDKNDPYVKKAMEGLKPLMDQLVQHFSIHPDGPPPRQG